MMPYSNALVISSRIGSGSCGPSAGKRYDKSKRESSPAPPRSRPSAPPISTARCKLYAKGPNDKVFCFLRLSRSRAT